MLCPRRRRATFLTFTFTDRYTKICKDLHSPPVSLHLALPPVSLYEFPPPLTLDVPQPHQSLGQLRAQSRLTQALGRRAG